MRNSAVPLRLLLYQDNTQRINLTGLRDDTGAFLNAAVLGATLLDKDRNQVSGCVNINLIYMPTSNGDYQGTVNDDFKPPVGTDYVMVIDGGEGASHLHIEIPTDVKVRTF